MKKFVLGIAALAAVATALVYAYPSAAKALAGRGNGCTVAKALEIERHKRELTASKDRILAASKLLKTDEAGFELYETPFGQFWTTKGSRFILPFNLAEEDVAIYGTGAQAVQKGDIVLDCGANVGVFARNALKAGAAKVVAIEPSPDNLECLRRNFTKELEDGRVVIYPKGVWDKDDILELLVDPDNRAADSFVIERKSAKPVLKLPLTTIDKLVAELELPKVDYIKMDIEGAETNALRGAKETIAKFKPRMSISTYHLPTDPVEVPKAIRAAWQDVRIDCGPCNRTDEGHVRADVLYFHP